MVEEVLIGARPSVGMGDNTRGVRLGACGQHFRITAPLPSPHLVLPPTLVLPKDTDDLGGVQGFATRAPKTYILFLPPGFFMPNGAGQQQDAIPRAASTSATPI